MHTTAVSLRARVRAVLGATVGAAVLLAGPTAGATAAGSTAAGSDAPGTTAPGTTAPGTTAPNTIPGQRVVAEGRVDVLSASRDDVRAEVTGIEARIRDQEAQVSFNRVAVQVAGQRSAAARTRADAARAAATSARNDVRDYAVEAFIRPPAQDALSVLAISKVDEAGYASQVLQIVADERGRVVDVMAAAEATARTEQVQADTASVAAQAQADQAQGQVDALQAVRSEQAQLVSRLDGRLDAALAEAASLRAIDARAAKALADQEIAVRASAPATPPVATPAVAPRTASAPTVGVPARGAGPSTTAPRTSPPGPATPTTRPPATAPSPPPPPPPGIVTWSDVVKVGGIWVNQRIAGQVRALLDAATAAGLVLGGGGFRDPASQIAVRQANCGTSSYAVYQMPASQCTPPTARPGTSMHEQGLAIDFLSSGRLIVTQSDPAFQWLVANAARFGFYNLASEPWHWSVNGN